MKEMFGVDGAKDILTGAIAVSAVIVGMM